MLSDGMPLIEIKKLPRNMQELVDGKDFPAKRREAAKAKAAGRNQYKVFTEVGQKGLFDTTES
mgnify:CR=1 FL=1